MRVLRGILPCFYVSFLHKEGDVPYTPGATRCRAMVPIESAKPAARGNGGFINGGGHGDGGESVSGTGGDIGAGALRVPREVESCRDRLLQLSSQGEQGADKANVTVGIPLSAPSVGDVCVGMKAGWVENRGELNVGGESGLGTSLEGGYERRDEGVVRWRMCGRKATFGNVAVGARPLACAEHRDLLHVDMCNRRCEQVGCSRVPSFGEVEGGRSECPPSLSLC